ncbi:MAG TPA: tetratricopeptide repeat protein [Candidatus Melainabacteria bacterium]|nr:tetratricopeptide repeat protein [Candidatus Melainabacteria bacterium]HIN66873.1 tetratricopeptide repeat protein [Candidatus Obscuribacterales bacterium]
MPTEFEVSPKYIIAGLLALALTAVAPADCKSIEGIQYDRAQALIREGHLDQASTILLKLYRLHPQNAVLLVELGQTYLNDTNEMAGGQIKAEQCFRKAIKLDSEFGKAYYHMAEWANAQSKYDLAIQMATKALTVKKPDMQAYMERAATYSHMHKDKEALADLDKFISLGKVERKAYERRACILENLNLNARALADYRVMQKLHFDDGTTFKEARCLEKLNKNSEAIACLTDLLKRNAEDDAAYEARGNLQVKQGRLKEAIADYSKAIELLPSATLYKQRADAYEKMGRKDLATRDRKEAERL